MIVYVGEPVCIIRPGIRALWYHDRHKHTSIQYTHILGPPVSQSVINRPKQQVLSLCLLLTANYEALQVCPTNHKCNQKLIQYQSLLLLSYNLCSLFICLLLLEAYAFSQTHTNTRMEMLLGQPPPVSMTQYISSVTPRLEPPEEQQEQQHGEKCRYDRGLRKGMWR